MVVALPLAGCAGSAPVAYDLVARLPVAERAGSLQTILFGTPAAEPHQAEGFFRWSGGPGDRFVWARGEVEVALGWDAPRERAAVVDLLPFEGVREQSVRVLLNGRETASFALAPARQRYLIPLPAAGQRSGENRLRFEFASTASAADVDPKSSDGGRLAAAFFSLSLGPADDPSLLDLLGREVPGPFSVAGPQQVPSFSQRAASSVRFAIELPGQAELRFTPSLHPAARARGGRAHLSVWFESLAGSPRELWSATLDGTERDPREVTLALPGVLGEAMALTLRVDGAPDARSAWAVWRAPRVLGRGASGSGAGGREAKLAKLRGALADKSVVLVILDAARARQLGCYGYGRATTPEIDRIARESVLFERAYTPAVYTVGAMSSVWTSQQPDQHHGETSFEARLPADRLTLAELLSGRGIDTAGFVANAMAGRALGFERGFAEFHEVFGDPELGSRAELFRDRLPAWLAAHKDRRFFLYVHFREPHFPYDPPPPFRTRFGPDAPLPPEASRERGFYVAVNQGALRPSPEQIEHLVRLYDGNLAYVDREVGELRRALAAAGLLDETVLILTADHGEQLHEHGYISHSAQVYEESTHVPLIVRLPRGAGPVASRVPALVDLTDLAPTIADVFGTLGQGGSDREFEGRSLLPVALGAPGRPVVVARSVWERPLYAIRDSRFKLIRDTRSGQEQLFDLGSDPREARVLDAAASLRGQWLHQELLAWAGRVRQRRAGAAEAGELTPEQCENMRSLGYLGGCPSPSAAVTAGPR